jgi:hypothetical protein
MWFVALSPHRNTQAFPPSTLGEFFYFLLTAEGFALSMLCVQKKPLEVTEAIEDQTSYLARERSPLFTFMLFVTTMLPSAFSSRRGQALAAVPLSRYHVPTALRDDAILALHSALEWYGVANQTFQTVYYFSARARNDVVFENVTYHRVAPPVALARAHKERFQTQSTSDGLLVTNRERSFVDCLLFLEYSGGLEELDKSLAMFPSFDFDAALKYLKLLRKSWLYSRLGFLLDRHADKLFFRGPVRDQFLRRLPPGVAYLGDKRPGNRWVPTWRVMVPETLAPPVKDHVQT